jgi:type I restriction enzyme S subunit
MDNLPKGWNYKKLDILVSKLGDGLHGTPKYSENGEYHFINGNNISNGNVIIKNETKKVLYEEFNKYKKQLNDRTIFVSINGTIGNVAFYNNEKVILGKSICYFNLVNGVDKYFMKYFLQSGYFIDYANNSATGSTIKNVPLSAMRNLEIPLPPLSEQTRIVAKLVALFARIDKSIALLEENIKHTKALMASVLEEVFHSSTKQIAVSEIVVKTVNINPLVEPDTQFTYIDITSVNNRLHQIEDPKIILGKNAPSRAKKLVVVGDIVFATTRPNLKNIAIVNKNYSNPVASTGFCVLRTKKEISNEFLFLCLLSNNVQEQIKPFIRGAQYPAISDSDLLKCKIPDLSYAQQIEFANKIMNLRNKLSKINSEQQSKLVYLKALKSSLLDRAFKGEL